MGKISNTMNYYFSDNHRFADLFNVVFFQGRLVVRAEELSEVSEVYHQSETEKPKAGFQGKRAERIRDVCKSYPLRLYCLNEAEDIERFHTEVSQLFRALKYRGDHTGLRKLLEENSEYQHLDRDTLEAMSFMLNLPTVWEKREIIMSREERITDVFLLPAYKGLVGDCRYK